MIFWCPKSKIEKSLFFQEPRVCTAEFKFHITFQGKILAPKKCMVLIHLAKVPQLPLLHHIVQQLACTQICCQVWATRSTSSSKSGAGQSYHFDPVEPFSARGWNQFWTLLWCPPFSNLDFQNTCLLLGWCILGDLPVEVRHSSVCPKLNCFFGHCLAAGIYYDTSFLWGRNFNMISAPQVRLSLPLASISFQIGGALSKSSVPGTKKSPSKFSMVKAAGQSWDKDIWSQVWFNP